ncbi:MAG TPA: uroporphyrinogen-III C-methyltransferase [Gammaproteobacteria bacterium]|nr:uroporphyrinogen-III C-methyltransferase [Gammaproteobacteria bacterium]
MNYLPLCLKLDDKPCLVVGAGAVGARKIAYLRHSGARVVVVAPTLSEDVLAQVADADGITLHQRAFRERDITGKQLVIAASSSPDVNAEVARLCRASGVPVNVVDDTDACTFVVPAVIHRGPVQVAISTGGASPVLARTLKMRLESYIPSAYGDLASLVQRYRQAVKHAFHAVRERKHFWERVLEGPIAELVFAGRLTEAEHSLKAAVANPQSASQEQGEVYLVGAGPGDPDLLTLRALRLMQQADVVVYDRLVSPPIIDMVRANAQRIYAGKKKSDHAIPQGGINALLVQLAREGKRVLRLKGGDPFIFGRGGEEIQTLIDEGVAFQIVPGVTAASGCATYSGIPLTHRDHSQACIFVTGHLKDGTSDLNWDMLANEQQTVVFYMGLQGVDVICRELIAHGRKATTPAALIQQGTTPSHRVLIGDLNSLPALVRSNDVRAPTLIIVGEVVSLHEKLKWFRPGEELIAPAVRDMHDYFEHSHKRHKS